MVFSPPFALQSGHLQTILVGSRLRRYRARHSIQRTSQHGEPRLIDCGQGVRLIGCLNRARPRDEADKPISMVHPSADKSPLAILLHGWEGCYESLYMSTATEALVNGGFDVFRLNLRDHGPSLHLNQALFNATLTDEVGRAIAVIIKQLQPKVFVLAGYSLGGNFALRIAADSGKQLGLTAAMAVCPPLDPARTMAILEKPLSPYQFYFYGKWRSSLQSKLHYFPELGFQKQLQSSRNLADINRFFIPGHTPYKRAEDYFAAYTLTGKRLAQMEIPALLLTAEDDPIIPIADLPAVQGSEQLQIEVTTHGGHCGYIKNGRLESWADQRLVAYFRSNLNTRVCPSLLK